MGSKRTPGSQSEHDKKVKQIANDYKKKGYDIEADILGYSKPPSVGGYVPDIRAKKGGQETIVEVETPESVDSTRDMQQKSAFEKWRNQDPKHHFKRKITD